MHRELSNTLDNACVRFVREGFEATHPFALGVIGFSGLSGALIANSAIESPGTTGIDANKQSVASPYHHEALANQVEGGAAVFAGPLLGVLAVSVITASFLRAKRFLVKNSLTT